MDDIFPVSREVKNENPVQLQPEINYIDTEILYL